MIKLDKKTQSLNQSGAFLQIHVLYELIKKELNNFQHTNQPMSYKVGGRCRNCGTDMCVEIPKGTVKEIGLKKAGCSHCGVVGSVEFNPYKNCP